MQHQASGLGRVQHFREGHSRQQDWLAFMLTGHFVKISAKDIVDGHLDEPAKGAAFRRQALSSILSGMSG